MVAAKKTVSESGAAPGARGGGASGRRPGARGNPGVAWVGGRGGWGAPGHSPSRPSELGPGPPDTGRAPGPLPAALDVVVSLPCVVPGACRAPEMAAGRERWC